MAAFSNTAFDTSAFSVGAFDIGSSQAPAVVETPPLVGGGIPHDYVRTKKDIARARERFGMPDAERLAALATAGQIAARQAEALETDEQKRFEELQRELQMRGIEWQAQYLEAMNAERQRLIDAEIGKLLKQQMEDEYIMLALLTAAL